MDLVEMTVRLPKTLVEEARDFDLLNEAQIAQLLRQEVDRHVNELVNEEIHAYRREKRAQHPDQT